MIGVKFYEKGISMHLLEYLHIKKMTVKDFAESIEYNAQSLYNLMKGRSLPSRRLISAVKMATDGQVDLSNPEDRKPQKIVFRKFSEEKRKNSNNDLPENLIFCKDCIQKLINLVSNK